MIKNVYVFTLKGDILTVLDTDDKVEINIDVSAYDKKMCRDLIGTRILIEENEPGEYAFAGTKLIKCIKASM